MTVLSRGPRPRRAGRRPGWLLLTVLLVLAIVASSALVFTNRVELLKLAVILALWAAVVAAFVSVIYRRQSDTDQAKVRDLKHVYDLQLDREISARREYELTVETQLRRELASELRAQSADEVAALRAELAALRANLEILFDTDFDHRPAIEQVERTTVRADWARDAETTGRVSASRLDSRRFGADDRDVRTEESPIIDVRAEPHLPEEWSSAPPLGGAHRRPSEVDPGVNGSRRSPEEPRGRRRAEVSPPPPPPSPPRDEPATPPRGIAQPWAPTPPPPNLRPQPAPPPPPPQEREPAPQPPRREREPVQQPGPPPAERPAAAGWRPAPAEGQWIPAGDPGSNWVAPPADTPDPLPDPVPDDTADSPAVAEYVGRRRAPEPSTSSPERRRGKHSAPADASDPGRPGAPPAPPAPEPDTRPVDQPEAEAPPGRRHRSVEDTGGQSVADLLARMGSAPAGGGRRRRRDE